MCICMRVVDNYQQGWTLEHGEVEIGTQVMQLIPPGLFWRFHMAVHHPSYMMFNISVSQNALLGIYGRRNIPPMHTQVHQSFCNYSSRTFLYPTAPFTFC